MVIVEESYSRVVWRWIVWRQGAFGHWWCFGPVGGWFDRSRVAGGQLREAAKVVANKAQQRIAQSERELSVLMRSVQELIFRIDAQGGHLCERSLGSLQR